MITHGPIVKPRISGNTHGGPSLPPPELELRPKLLEPPKLELPPLLCEELPPPTCPPPALAPAMAGAFRDW
jgi:hypothetical protein